MEVCEGVCWILCMRSSEKPSSSPIWTLSTIAHSFYTMVFNLHGLHHRFATSQFIWFHINGDGLLDKYGSFYSMQQINNQWRTTKLFLDHVFWYHGLLEDIISDHGPQLLASKFWKRFLELLSMKMKLSLAFHPQIDGQIEWVNQILEQYLHCTTNYRQNSWSDLLSVVEFTYNNIVHFLTQQTPLFANHSLHPRFNI